MPRIKQNDKRDRLVEAADKLIYEKTFHTTTLADIAKEADVPLGNVYYYFKTKDAIMEAVIQKRAQEWQHLFGAWEQLSNPKERLVALINHTVGQADLMAQFGCIVGSLCQELGKQGGTISAGAAKLMHDIVKWAEKQFSALGKENENAGRLAEYLVSGIQGMTLLTLTFKEPGCMERQRINLENWLASV
jgi:TetR/AcrR family transcriptional repressor of nem operon